MPKLGTSCQEHTEANQKSACDMFPHSQSRVHSTSTRPLPIIQSFRASQAHGQCKRLLKDYSAI